MNTTKYAMRLYAVTDSSWLRGRSLAKMVEDTILGGATFVQLREKELDQEAFIALAKEVKQITDRYHVPFVINDNVEVAPAAMSSWPTWTPSAFTARATSTLSLMTNGT